LYAELTLVLGCGLLHPHCMLYLR